MRWIYDDAFNFGRGLPFLKQVHGFVLDKPARIRRHLLDQGVARATDFEIPVAPTEDDLRAIHVADVVAGWHSAGAIARAVEMAPLAWLPTAIVRRLIVTPQIHACGGTELALRHAAKGEWAISLSGGFHHARPNLVHGFCLVNDVAWAVHRLNESGQHPRILVLDLDLHQGDGNAAMFSGRADVFTVSLHQEDTFPLPKLKSHLDVGLCGKVGDEEYHRELDALLDRVADAFAPEIVVYVAGTDPFEGDAIGSFRVTRAGLVERDRMVARFARRVGASLVALPAGGYSSESPAIAAAGFAAMAEIATTAAPRA